VIPLQREVPLRNDRWLAGAVHALLTALASVAFWLLMCAAIGGCWRGNGPLPICPGGVTSTNSGGSGPVCEPRSRTVRHRPKSCAKLTELVGELPDYPDGSECEGADPIESCLVTYYQERSGALQWWAERAVAWCSP
jgi:hypothetical protein